MGQRVQAKQQGPGLWCRLCVGPAVQITYIEGRLHAKQRLFRTLGRWPGSKPGLDAGRDKCRGRIWNLNQGCVSMGMSL